MSRRRTPKPAADQSEPVRPGPGVNAFLESLKGRRIAGEPDAKLDDLRGHELKEARSILQGFTRAGAPQRPRRPVDFDDPIQRSVLELQGKIMADPRPSGNVGAWLSRMKDRGAGHCTPLQGAAEGLHVLVLDAPAVAEMWAAMDGHRASVASYAQLQADLAQLRKLRGDDAGTGEAD
jgi:hypothetical protein